MPDDQPSELTPVELEQAKVLYVSTVQAQSELIASVNGDLKAVQAYPVDKTHEQMKSEIIEALNFDKDALTGVETTSYIQSLGDTLRANKVIPETLDSKKYPADAFQYLVNSQKKFLVIEATVDADRLIDDSQTKSNKDAIFTDAISEFQHLANLAPLPTPESPATPSQPARRAIT